jgi:hypothetical protein
MGIPKAFGKELLVMGLLLSAGADREALLGLLRRNFGPIEEESPEEPFLWTDYYAPEMGEGIRRIFLLFADPADPQDLARIKARTDELELEFSGGPKRSANLDPGLLAPSRLVLATTKDRAQRIALSGGIYAELTLIYQKGAYRALPWTYPDWASEPVTSLLGKWRTKALSLDRSGART